MSLACYHQFCTPLARMNKKLDLTSEAPEYARAPELEKYLSLINTLKGREEFLLDENGIIISTNLEAVNITGYEEYEVIGKDFSIFYLDEEKEKALKDLQRAMTLGQIVVTGLRVKKRGIRFWAKMKIVHVVEKGFFKITLQDSTHRALSNMRVQSIRDEYLAIFNNPFVGAFKFRMADFKMMMCNQKTLEITAIPSSDNLYFNSIFNSPLQFEQFLLLLKQEKRVEGFQFLINAGKNPQGNWGVISARSFDNQGFVEGVLMDISEQYNQMVELQRINSELDNFTYHASHDLRAPLTTIMGLVNLGEKENSIEISRSYYEMIRSKINHLDLLLKDLISVSYNSKAEVAVKSFSFKEEVALILESMKYPGHPFRIEVDIKQDLGFGSDPIRLRTILRNLLSNAFKYFNPTINRPYIGLVIEVDPKCAAIHLKDNGIGIEREYKDKIYNIFFRGTTRSTGSGLGLYIVKSMIDKLEGKIFVESIPEEGTTFSLIIPNRLGAEAQA
jgi:PAS domain S-box-containing protein